MTCTSCIEKVVKSTSEAISIKISLLIEHATVEYDPTVTSDGAIASLINSLGFEASPAAKKGQDIVELQIYGLKDPTDAYKCEQNLLDFAGVSSVSVDNTDNLDTIRFDDENLDVRDIVCKIDDLGFNV